MLTTFFSTKEKKEKNDSEETKLLSPNQTDNNSNTAATRPEREFHELNHILDPEVIPQEDLKRESHACNYVFEPC